MTAGTLFLGEFSINLSNTLKSTKFGIPFVKEAFPKSLEVEWSYQAGAKYYATNGAKDANGKFQPVENDDDNKTLMVLKPDAPPMKDLSLLSFMRFRIIRTTISMVPICKRRQILQLSLISKKRRTRR